MLKEFNPDEFFAERQQKRLLTNISRLPLLTVTEKQEIVLEVTERTAATILSDEAKKRLLCWMR